MTRRTLLAAAALTAGGIATLVVPDDGPRLVAFSDSHGLTVLDAAGTVLLVAGWALALRAAWSVPSVRGRVAASWRGGTMPLLTGLGAGLVIAGAARDFAGWWVAGAALMLGVQVAVLVPALRDRRGDRAD